MRLSDETVMLPFPTPPKHRGADAWEKARFNGTNSQIPNALFNDVDTTFLLDKELPIHRRMVTLVEQGYNVKEIAAATGYSVRHVSDVLRQPFAREHIVKTLQDDVSQEIKNFLEAEVLPSLKVIKEVRDNELAKASDRLAAANCFLDRQMGRPNQPFTLPSTSTKALSDYTAAELETAIAAERSVAGSPTEG